MASPSPQEESCWFLLCPICGPGAPGAPRPSHVLHNVLWKPVFLSRKAASFSETPGRTHLTPLSLEPTSLELQVALPRLHPRPERPSLTSAPRAAPRQLRPRLHGLLVRADPLRMPVHLWLDCTRGRQLPEAGRPAALFTARSGPFHQHLSCSARVCSSASLSAACWD